MSIKKIEEKMIYRIQDILKKMIGFSQRNAGHLEFVKAVHQLLKTDFDIKESAIILGIDSYFLKSTYTCFQSESWQIRTNDLSDSDRFSRLAAIALKEMNFQPDHDLLFEIIDNDKISGYIVIPQLVSDQELSQIIAEIQDFFFLVCKSLFRQYQLKERVKELSCLQNISKIAENQEISIAELLTQVVNILPPAWQYPDQAQARIVYEDQEFSYPGFAVSELNLQAVIKRNKSKIGLVEVNYPHDFIQDDSFPFLKEEDELIRTIAQELSFILEKKHAENESKQLEKQLLHADRLATLGQLSAGIAHEINEPLAGILGLSQLLEKNQSLDEQALKDLENIVSASLHAREVVKKLMLFAHQMPSMQSILNLNESVKNAVFFLESRCRKNMVRINMDLKTDLPSIQADSSQIHQVLINLIVNALQAMPQGGIITLKTYSDETSVFMECLDTGIGMTKSVLSQIFNPFFTTKKVNEGTGLGLSVVHGIIYSHGGEISVTSQPGKGTKFTISFSPISKTEK